MIFQKSRYSNQFQDNYLGIMHRQIFNNFFFYSLSQVVNLLTPLLVIPYLIQKIGVDLIGVIILCQTVMIYLTVILDYHFNLVAVKELSLSRNNQIAVQSIFLDTFFTKVFLCLICAVCFFALMLAHPILRHELLISGLSFTILIGQLLINNWFFQGVENLHILALLNILSKAIYLFTVFFWVKSPSQAYLPNLLLGGSSIAAGITGMFYLTKKFNISFKKPNIKKILNQLREGFIIFLSNSSVIIYTNFPILILGFFVTPIILGEYGISDKIIGIVRAVLAIFFATTYSRVSFLSIKGWQPMKKFYQTFYLAFLFAIFVCCTLIFIESKEIIFYFKKSGNNKHLISILRLSCFIPIITCLNIPAYQVLLVFNKKKAYSSILIIACFISLFLFLLLIPTYKVEGAIYAMILTELFVTIMFWYHVKK